MFKKTVIDALKIDIANRLLNIKYRVRGFNDYFKFPFDIERPMNSAAKEDFLETVKILRNLNEKYWLADGTLLGFIREKRFISHDTDIDFYVDQTFPIDRLIQEMQGIGMKIGRSLKYRKKYSQVTFYSLNENIIDFCVWHNNYRGSYTLHVPEIAKPRVQPEIYFKSMKSIDCYGVEVCTFEQPELWLEMIYGQEWKTPEVVKNDWRINIRDLSD